MDQEQLSQQDGWAWNIYQLLDIGNPRITSWSQVCDQMKLRCRLMANRQLLLYLAPHRHP